jgi:hypothetical protein
VARIEIDRLAREQHREIEPRLAQRFRAELPSERDARLGCCVLLLHQRHRPRDRGGKQQ